MQLICRARISALARWYRLIGPLYLRACRLTFGKSPSLFGLPIVSMAPSSLIALGDRAVLCSNSLFTALGVNHPVVLRTLRSGAEIRIGNDAGLSGTTICAAQSVVIGDNALIGANVTIADTDFHALDPQGRRYNQQESSIRSAPVRIEDNVFIGTGSIVLKGVTIGENSVIGAGSVVSSSIPRNSIAAGNPCRVLRRLEPGHGSAGRPATSDIETGVFQ